MVCVGVESNSDPRMIGENSTSEPPTLGIPCNTLSVIAIFKDFKCHECESARSLTTRPNGRVIPF